MKRIQEKIRYKEYLFDVIEEVDVACKLYYLCINPCDVYEIQVCYCIDDASKLVANYWDVWNVSQNESIDDLVDEIASQYFFVR